MAEKKRMTQPIVVGHQRDIVEKPCKETLARNKVKVALQCGLLQVVHTTNVRTRPPDYQWPGPYPTQSSRSDFKLASGGQCECWCQASEQKIFLTCVSTFLTSTGTFEVQTMYGFHVETVRKCPFFRISYFQCTLTWFLLSVRNGR